MSASQIKTPATANISDNGARFPRRLGAALALCIAGLLATTGCQTSKPVPPSVLAQATAHTESIVLREGDIVKISFPSARNNDTTQAVRRDGNINLNLVGEVKAVGRTPDELKEELLKRYKGQIDSEQINVELLSSSFPIFVTGAVTHAQKILSDHPITALEAIMEAGGPDYSKANLMAVKVLGQENGSLKNYVLNLKSVLDGSSSQQFYLKPADIIYVPEKFVWF